MKQTFTSASTSINKNKLPAIISKIEKINGFVKGGANLDLGGGRFDNVSNYLKCNHNITNMILDPFNRTLEHNENIEQYLLESQVDSVIISNVLNVINDNDSKLKLLQKSFDNLKNGGSCFVTVYEGDRSGVGKQTGSDQWQENKKLDNYLSSVSKIFGNAKIKYGMIIAYKNV